MGMRKILAAVCLVLLLVCMAPSASAKTNSQSIDVTAKTASVSVTPVCYSVDIVWSDMTFTYTEENIHTWNASNHSYRTSTRGSWDKTQATITVTNHSNVDVQVKITYTPVEGTGITGVLKSGSAKLKAGSLGEYDNADSMTAKLTIKGTPTDAVTEEGSKIGTVLVTIQ